MKVNRNQILMLVGLVVGMTGLSGCRPAIIMSDTPVPTQLITAELTPVVAAETAQQENSTQTPSPTQAAQPTSTLPPSPSETPLQPTPTPTTGPLCTVLTDLNLRSGPGTAYRPPLRVLPAGYEVIPVGFNPVGTPGGPWVQVRDETRNETGWVSAGQQFVSCNLELTNLPQVAVELPPPPSPPRVTNSIPDGSCFPDWECELDFNPAYLLRMKVFDIFFPDPVDGDGIQAVSFTVTDSTGAPVYQRTITSSPFCIFGSRDSSCNPWIIEDYAHRWAPGGVPAGSGDFRVTVNVTGINGDEGEWRIDVNLQFP
jgi:hypothetical protein